MKTWEGSARGPVRVRDSARYRKRERERERAMQAVSGCGDLGGVHMRASEARGIMKRTIYDAAAHRPPTQPPSFSVWALSLLPSANQGVSRSTQTAALNGEPSPMSEPEHFLDWLNFVGEIPSLRERERFLNFSRHNPKRSVS